MTYRREDFDSAGEPKARWKDGRREGFSASTTKEQAMGLFDFSSPETLRAGTINSSDGPRIDQFVSPPATPGHVAVCISGGGSRAMTAGMGQLRALKHLQLNGESLLDQTRALSTVSGIASQ